MAVVIKIAGFADGKPSVWDGKYCVEFNFTNWSKTKLVEKPEDAKKFDDVIEARDYWMTINSEAPVRPDGKPNRPFTAFNIILERYPSA